MSTVVNGVGEILQRCREEGRAALVGYLPVGFPTVEGSLEAMRVLVEAGCDIVEVGVPYSDPLMDGPVIQHAASTALAGGARVDDVFRATQAVRDAGGAALVMTYWNLVLRRGVERFAADLASSGGAGLITPDLIPDEAGEWIAASDAHGLDRVFLVAPSSTPRRRWASPAPARVSTPTPVGSSSAPGPSPTCRSAWGSVSPPAPRPPSSPRTPTGSSSAPPSSARSPGRGNSVTGSRRCAL